MNHRPIAIGMVLCEQVIVEVGTHNVTPVNCFNFREVNVLPGEASFFALAWLADGMGEMMVELTVERLDTFEDTFRLNRKLVFPDRLHDMRFSARIRGHIFPIAGDYQVSLVIDRNLLAHRKLRVRKKGKSP